MPRQNWVSLSLALAVALSSAAPMGCTSIAVRKVAANDKTTRGVRYSLPKPAFVGTALADDAAEGVAFEAAYFPDADQTYAVEAESFLSAYKLDVTVTKGLLDKVDFSQNSAAVPAQVATDAGGIAKAAIDARTAEREAAAKSRAEARKAVEDAKAAVRLADFHIEEAKRLPQGTQEEKDARAAAIAKAEAEKREAEFKLKEAEAALKSLRRGDVAPDEAPADGSIPKLPRGPQLFMVVEDAKTVKLVPLAK